MTTVLRHVAVVDGTGAPPRRDVSVVLDGAVIAAVTDASVPAVFDDHDLAGLTVMPGFVDAHVHLCFTGGGDPLADVAIASDQDLFRVAAENAAAALAAGVTTVRDCGSRGLVAHQVREHIAAGRIPGPRVLVAGAPICAARGHLWFMGGALVGSPAEAVRDRVAAGADHIKVMASGGHMTPGSRSSLPELSGEILSEITATAHQLGVRVAAHAHATEAIARCVDAGVDTIEHCSWLSDAGIDYRPDVVEAMLAKDIVVSPAVPAYFRLDPATVSDDVAEVEYMRRLVSGRRDTTALMRAAGVPIVVGTDAGCRGIRFDAYSESLRVYADLFGFAPLEAIRAATSDAAAAIGLGGEVGKVAPGLRADLVVVDGDPSTDLGAIDRVRRVYLAGQRVDGRPNR